MMYRRIGLFLLIFLSVGIINAQTEDAPLWFVMDGYLYTWTANEVIQQETSADYINQLALSPDNTNFASIKQPRDLEFPHRTAAQAGEKGKHTHCLQNVKELEGALRDDFNVPISW